MECRAVSVSLPRDSSRPGPVFVRRIPAQPGIFAQPFLRRNDRAVHNRAKTTTMATDCRTMSIVADLLFLLTKVGDSNPYGVLDDYNFAVADQRRANQDVDVVARRAGNADHAVRAQLQDLRYGHDPMA